MLLRIRDARKKAGLSQSEFARRMGVSLPAVSFWESGAQRPTIDKLPKIAMALSCTIDELYAAGDNSIVPEKEGEVHGQEHAECNPKGADQ